VLDSELGPLVGLARRWHPFPPRAGIVLLSSLRSADRARASAVVDRLAPAVVAVEDSDCRPAAAAALRALRSGSRALVGVCTRAPERAAHRLVDVASAAERVAWTEHLESGLAAILAADGTVIPVDRNARATAT
jgi:hypothetical protein